MKIYLLAVEEHRGKWSNDYKYAYKDEAKAKEKLAKFADRKAKVRPMSENNGKPKKGEYVYAAANCDAYFSAWHSNSDYVLAEIEEVTLIG